MPKSRESPGERLAVAGGEMTRERVGRGKRATITKPVTSLNGLPNVVGTAIPYLEGKHLRNL